MKKKLYITIGLPGSGKSTWSKKIQKKEKNTIIISRDSIRTMLNGGYAFVPEQEEYVLDLSRIAIKKAMQAGFNIIIDETLLKTVHRAELYRELFQNNLGYEKDWRKKYKIIYVVFKMGLDGYLAYNLMRRKRDKKEQPFKIWEKVIKGMYSTWTGIDKGKFGLDKFDEIIYI